jgi:hypothetical protein
MQQEMHYARSQYSNWWKKKFKRKLKINPRCQNGAIPMQQEMHYARSQYSDINKHMENLM